MHLVFGTLKTLKKDFYCSEHQKRKDEFCPLSSLAFLQPTTVDKEPKKAASPTTCYFSNDDLQISLQPLYFFKILIVIVLISIRILGRSLVNT